MTYPTRSRDDVCFVYVDDAPATWLDADDYCLEQYGGALARVTSQEDQDLIGGFIASDDVTVWLGAREFFTDWKWNQGDQLDEGKKWNS